MLHNVIVPNLKHSHIYNKIVYKKYGFIKSHMIHILTRYSLK